MLWTRILSFVVALAATMVLPAQIAVGGRQWCETDPILEFANGARVQWVTQFDTRYLGSVSGVEYRYVVPANAGRIAVAFPASEVHERVTIAYDGPAWSGRGDMRVSATVIVRASRSFSTKTMVRGNVRHDADLGGRSNEPTMAGVHVDEDNWGDLIGSAVILRRVTVATTATVTGP